MVQVEILFLSLFDPTRGVLKTFALMVAIFAPEG